MRDDWRADVARAIADHKAIDWEAVDGEATDPADPSLVAELRVLERVARVHTTPASDLDERRDVSSLDVLPSVWGPLTVLEHIGRGSSGDVYRAHDPRLDRTVALKVLRRRASDTGTSVIAEARLLARVTHPNVVTVHGAERIGEEVGVWMSFIDGPTLEDELDTNGPFDPRTVVSIGLDLCAALDAAHRAGILHRDVKTANVMRASDGRLVLTDFGAGRDVLAAGTATAGDLTGTPLYVAPEVLAGKPATAQSDLYSLGVVLFHLLTGVFPLNGRTLDELRHEHASGTRRRIREVRPDTSARLSRIVDRCLEPDAADRFPSVAAVAEALEHVSPRSKTTRRALATLAAALAVVTAAFAVERYDRAPLAPPAPADETLSMRRVSRRGSTSVTGDGRYLLSGAFLQNLASGDERRWHPETEAGGLGLDPRLSRDGTDVAYEFCTAFQRCELRLMSLDARSAGNWRTLVRDPDPDVRVQALDWSPDGLSILVQRMRAGSVREIGIVSKETGSFLALTRVDWRGTRAFFSPDGLTFAFDTAAGETEWRRDVFAMSVTGGERVPLVIGPANDEFVGWSPRGDRLLFVSDRSGAMDLWSMSFSNGHATGSPERMKAGVGNIRPVGITEAGSLLFRAPANEVDIELASVDLSTGRRLAATRRPPQSVPGTNLEPAWSRDGEFLAYVSQRAGDGLAGSLVIYAVRTGAVRELPLASLAWAQGLSWAPDGRSLVVTAVSLKGGCGLFGVNVQTGEVSAIAYPIPLTFQGGHWSPDGTRLYYQPVSGGIFEWDLALGAARTISPAPRAEAWQNIGPISVSPDGRWIAEYGRAGERLQVVKVRSIDGGEPREIFRLSDGELDVIPMPWAPSSDAVIVRRYAAPATGQAEPDELWLIPLDGKSPRRLDLDLGAAVGGQLGKIRLSPDGRHLAYVVGKSYQTETWALENFLPKQAALGLEARR